LRFWRNSSGTQSSHIIKRDRSSTMSSAALQYRKSAAGSLLRVLARTLVRRFDVLLVESPAKEGQLGAHSRVVYLCYCSRFLDGLLIAIPELGPSFHASLGLEQSIFEGRGAFSPWYTPVGSPNAPLRMTRQRQQTGLPPRGSAPRVPYQHPRDNGPWELALHMLGAADLAIYDGSRSQLRMGRSTAVALPISSWRSLFDLGQRKRDWLEECGRISRSNPNSVSRLILRVQTAEAGGICA